MSLLPKRLTYSGQLKFHDYFVKLSPSLSTRNLFQELEKDLWYPVTRPNTKKVFFSACHFLDRIVHVSVYFVINISCLLHNCTCEKGFARKLSGRHSACNDETQKTSSTFLSWPCSIPMTKPWCNINLRILICAARDLRSSNLLVRMHPSG